MKKQLSISLLLVTFLFFTVSSYASFPVKKITTNNTITSVDSTVEVNNAYTVNFSASSSEKSQIVAALVCWFVGIFGIHRFYLGYTWQGIVQLLTLGVFGIWTLIDLIRIIMGSLTPKNGAYDKTF